MELSYWNIKEMMGDEVVATGESDEYGMVFFQHEPIRGEHNEVLDDAYRASFVTKRNDEFEWWCHHIYHEDGIIEELFEHIPC